VVDAFFNNLGEIIFIYREQIQRISGMSHLQRFHDMLEKGR
jgi:hypothetical protein